MGQVLSGLSTVSDQPKSLQELATLAGRRPRLVGRADESGSKSRAQDETSVVSTKPFGARKELS